MTLLPPKVAVRVAVELTLSDEAVAVKSAVVAPDGTVTAEGTLSAPLLLARETAAPPPGAAALKVTVQVLPAPEVKEEGLQDRVVRLRGAARLIVKLCEPPFNVAVISTVESEATFPAVTLKDAEVAPEGTTTVPLMDTEELLLDKLTGVAPLGDGVLSVTVQVLVAPEVSVAGLQVRPVRRTGATRLTEKFCELPFRLAVITAVELDVKVAAVAVKLAEVAPEGTVTDPGTVNELLLLASATVEPPPGAAALKVTVQVLPAPEFNEDGLHVKPVSSAGATRFKEELSEPPFKEAVIAVVELVESVPAVAVKFAEVAPEATVTDPGTVNELLLLVSATVVPPLGATVPMVTVHVLLPPEFNDDGLQVSPVSCVGTTRLTE